MRNFWLAIVALIALHRVAARACGSGPTCVEWKQWTVQSSENLWLGRIHGSYPLTNLFDNDPRTAWVFSGRCNCDVLDRNDRYSLILTPGVPVKIDEVRIMNGYNRSPELFARNNRISEMKISADDVMSATGGHKGTLLKTVKLGDKMGWHIISLPRRKFKSLKLTLTNFFQGPDKDICISGIELYDRGRKIDMKMPAAVHFDSGFIDVLCKIQGPMGMQGSLIIDTRKNCVLVQGEVDDEGDVSWSPTGLFVCGESNRVNASYFWVVDSSRCKIIYRARLSGPVSRFYDVRWLGYRKLALIYEAPNQKAKRTKTIQFI